MLDFQDSRYMLNIQGFGHPVPTPAVGAVYDRTITAGFRGRHSSTGAAVRWMSVRAPACDIG